MVDTNNSLGIQATINGDDINKGAADFIRKLGEMEAASTRVTSSMVSGLNIFRI